VIKSTVVTVTYIVRMCYIVQW